MRESKLWAWHIVSAVVILVLLGLHMATMHLGAILSFIGLGSTDPVAAEHVFARSRQAAYMVGYIILLGAGLFHGLYGLRSIIFELSIPKGLKKTAGSLCVIVGIGLFVYGSYVAVMLSKGVQQ